MKASSLMMQSLIILMLKRRLSLNGSLQNVASFDMELAICYGNAFDFNNSVKYKARHGIVQEWHNNWATEGPPSSWMIWVFFQNACFQAIAFTHYRRYFVFQVFIILFGIYQRWQSLETITYLSKRRKWS